VFLPDFHFPSDRVAVEVTGGKWTVTSEDVQGGVVQKLRWWHAEGEQRVKISGQVRRMGAMVGREEEEGYLEQCQQTRCALM
jgi:hypothetical protein